MKIAILLLNSGRGSGEVARHQARYLASRGGRVFFLHPGVGDGVPGAVNRDVELHTDIVPVHEYLPAAGRRQQQVARMPYEHAVRYLSDYERALEPVVDDVDIVLGHHANISAVATANVARRAGKPYALFLHGTGIEPRHEGLYDDRLWAMIQRAIEDAAGILVTTDYVRDHLVRRLVDLSRDRFLVLPCGVDLDEFRPRPERDRAVIRKYALAERYVICPGAMTRSKGPQNVVLASRQYADVAQTVFIGGGELQERIAADLDGRGKVLGFVSAADKTALIGAATILAGAPEKMEHFGIIYAEALAAGTPPVAYEGGGVSSIITPGTGVLTARDPVALGRAIRELVTDPNRLAAMALEGGKRAREEFSWLELGRRLEDWLIRLTALDD